MAWPPKWLRKATKNLSGLAKFIPGPVGAILGKVTSDAEKADAARRANAARAEAERARLAGQVVEGTRSGGATVRRSFWARWFTRGGNVKGT